MKPSESPGTFSGHQGTLLTTQTTLCHILGCPAIKEFYPEPQGEPPNLCSSFLLRIFVVLFIRGPSASHAIEIHHISRIKRFWATAFCKRLYLNLNPIYNYQNARDYKEDVWRCMLDELGSAHHVFGVG